MAIRLGLEKRCEQLNMLATRTFQNKLQDIDPDVDAVIAIGKFSDEQVQTLSQLTGNLVFVDQDQLGHGYDSVVTDFDVAVQQVVDYFWQHDQHEIGLICGSESTTDGKLDVLDPRYTAYCRDLQERGAFDPKLVFTGDYTSESGYEQMQAAVTRLGAKLPHAFFVSNDPMAAGALKALRENEIAVPDRVSLFSFNDTTIAKYVFPELSSVHVNTEMLGAEAADLVADRLQTGRQTPQRVTIGTELIVRESTLK